MTWEELAKFIESLPEEEKKRPVFVWDGEGYQEFVFGRRLYKYFFKDHFRVHTRCFCRSAFELEEGDWVIK